MPIDQPMLQAPECYCMACGYSLRGLERAGRCPECGRVFDLDEPATFTDQPVHPTPKPITLGIAVGGVVATGGLGLAVLTLLPYSFLVWPLGVGVVLARVAVTVALVVAAVWTYRRLKLPMLPWLIAYWIIGAVLQWVSPLLMREFIDHGTIPAGYTLGAFINIWTLWTSLTGVLMRVLVIAMLMSEAAFLMSRMIDQRPRTMVLLLTARQHAVAFGMVLIGLTLLNPVLILLLWLL